MPGGRPFMLQKALIYLIQQEIYYWNNVMVIAIGLLHAEMLQQFRLFDMGTIK